MVIEGSLSERFADIVPEAADSTRTSAASTRAAVHCDHTVDGLVWRANVKPGHVQALARGPNCLVPGEGTGLVDTTAPEDGCRTIIDSRGVAVQVPTHIERVVTASAGLIEGTMLVLGEEEKIVGVGSVCVQKISDCTVPTVSGEIYEYRGGMEPVTYLSPRLRDLPLVGEGTTMNYETLTGLDPDVVILRVTTSMVEECRR